MAHGSPNDMVMPIYVTESVSDTCRTRVSATQWLPGTEPPIHTMTHINVSVGEMASF